MDVSSVGYLLLWERVKSRTNYRRNIKLNRAMNEFIKKVKRMEGNVKQMRLLAAKS